MKCSTDGCDAEVEANLNAGFTLHDDGLWGLNYVEGMWALTYMGDDCGTITCADGHDNWTPELQDSLSTYIEQILPGTTWQGSAPPTVTPIG